MTTNLGTVSDHLFSTGKRWGAQQLLYSSMNVFKTDPEGWKASGRQNKLIGRLISLKGSEGRMLM